MLAWAAAMASTSGSRRREVKRSHRLLQLFSLALMGVGSICLFVPISTDGLVRFCGAVSIASGASGVVGLAFTWYRALVAFTTCSWLASLLAVYGITHLVISKEVVPFPWVAWICAALTALPPAILSSTLHILRVFRPLPMVSDSTAPLVATAAADEGLPPADHPPAHGDYVQAADTSAPPARPVWPPPVAPQPSSGAVAAGSSATDLEAPVADRPPVEKPAFPAPPAWPPQVD